MSQVAALFVETAGAYFGLPGVDPWDEPRDARKYTGPHPVVAHSPCQRWGRYWHGAPCKPHQFRLGEDGGCFAAALTAVRNYGGVLEHPKDSHAWEYFGLAKPPIEGGWVRADSYGGWTCCVWQGHYGAFRRQGDLALREGRRSGRAATAHMGAERQHRPDARDDRALRLRQGAESRPHGAGWREAQDADP